MGSGPAKTQAAKALTIARVKVYRFIEPLFSRSIQLGQPLDVGNFLTLNQGSAEDCDGSARSETSPKGSSSSRYLFSTGGSGSLIFRSQRGRKTGRGSAARSMLGL